MLPLSMSSAGDKVLVQRVGGTDEVRQHLADLGFVPGTQVTVVANTGEGNIIVKVKDTRLALTSQMASKVQVEA